MKKVVVRVLKRALKEKNINLKDLEIENLIEVPPSPEMGDYAFPCFSLSNKLKDEPHEIAIELRKKIGNYPTMEFEDVQTKGPYLNFFVNRKSLAKKTVWEILTKKNNFGKSDIGKRKKIIVEFSSPNIAKPFGIGHLRSTIIGNSLANIFDFQGFKSVRINYLGDWGTQFGKLLLGYEKFGSEKQFEKNPIAHLLKVYVKINKKKYEKGAREKFKKLEEKDRASMLLWKLFRNFSLKEFKEMYKKLGINFNSYEFESLHNKKSKKILDELKDKKLIVKSKGALIVDLKKYGLGDALVEKSDGATLYITRDLSAAVERYNKYSFEKMVYEVGQEQKLYFRQLFKILELMGYKWAKNCVHVDHGLYLDKKGKKFSTRKGKTVFMDNILDETFSLAQKEIRKRDVKISKKEIERRAWKIALASIFYGDLKNNRANNIIFDIKKFVSFEGNTGPYILYSYARASSILTKASEQKKFEVHGLDDKEVELIKKLSQFPEVVAIALNGLNPSVIANYSYNLAQIFNEFYHNCKVIGSEQEAFRLTLVQAFRQVMKNSLKLLGIDVLEEM